MAAAQDGHREDLGEGLDQHHHGGEQGDQDGQRRVFGAASGVPAEEEPGCATRGRGGQADVVTVLILITACAERRTGLRGGSRGPYDEARGGVFFRAVGRLHPRHGFPVHG
ncbi:hypothetical protein UK12_34125, partial [Saccharothrix sp. ST-888]